MLGSSAGCGRRRSSSASTEDLGKTAGKDAEAGKLTYVSLLGLDGARAKAAALDEVLPAEEGDDTRLLEAMRYSALGGGKRVRPALCLLACQAAGGDRERAVFAG